MQTADNVARWFLSRNQVRFMDSDTEYITNLKLQKLLYYAQGMHLGYYDQKLFDDPVLAWNYGPVVKAVYEQYKCNNSEGIRFFTPPVENFTTEEEDTLQFTNDAFGQFSAWKLVDMTHEEEPWKSTPIGNTISVEKIKTFFKAQYVN